MNTRLQPGRKLRPAELAIVSALAPSMTAGLDAALVVEMQDGGMGSIRFLKEANRLRSRCIAEAQYEDDDGVLAIIELSVDEMNEL